MYLRAPETAYEVASLEAAGVPREKIVDCRSHPHVCADLLVVPSPLLDIFEATSLSCDFLNSLFAPSVTDSGPRTRIFVSRRAAAHRRMVNENEILALLEPLGFKAVMPEQMALAEQARVFAGAEVVIAPHGSGLANYVYCRPGGTVVEIVNPRGAETGCMTIAARRGLRHGMLYGDGIDPAEDVLLEDMYLDLEKLQRMLYTLGIT